MVAAAAPRKEKSTVSLKVAAGTKIMASARPSPAPALIPRTEGLAMGFRVDACIRLPDTARLLPTAAATTARGTRSVWIMMWLLFVGS